MPGLPRGATVCRDTALRTDEDLVWDQLLSWQQVSGGCQHLMPWKQHLEMLSLPIWEGWRAAGVNLLSEIDLVVVVVLGAFLSSFSKLLVAFLQGNLFVSFLSRLVAFGMRS